MDALFLRVLTTACIVSVLLVVLLFPARGWMRRRYAPQVRWGLWCGLAAVLLFGVCFSGFAAVPETVWELPNYTITLPAEPSLAPQAQSSSEPVSPSTPRVNRIPEYI